MLGLETSVDRGYTASRLNANPRMHSPVKQERCNSKAKLRFASISEGDGSQINEGGGMKTRSVPSLEEVEDDRCCCFKLKSQKSLDESTIVP